MSNQDDINEEFKRWIESENIACCDQLIQEKNFLETLSADEKKKTIKLFLKRASKELGLASSGFEEKMLRFLRAAEELAISDCPELSLSHIALLFRLGVISQNSDYLFHALHKIHDLESLCTANTGFWELWGHVLMALGNRINKTLYFEEAIIKYEKSLEIFSRDGTRRNDIDTKGALYWDLGKAWFSLGEYSQEMSDYLKALQAFKNAETLGIYESYFWRDFGRSLLKLAELDGSIDRIGEAIVLFQKGILASEKRKKKSGAFRSNWKLLTKSRSLLALMTGDEKSFKRADETFQEAILASPLESDLWLEWANLHTRFGIMVKDLSLLESALDKLASSQITHCNGVKVLALISEIFCSLGLFLEKPSLIKEGEKRIQTALQAQPKDPDVLAALGKSFLYYGIYFEDERVLPLAIQEFKSCLAQKTYHIGALEGLVHGYLVWGEKEKNPYFIKKAISTIEQLIHLRPFNPYYYAEKGLAYFKLWMAYKNEGIKDFKEEKCGEILHKAHHFLDHAIELKGGIEALPPYDWIYYLGCICDLLGEFEEDEKYYEKSIKILSWLIEKESNVTQIMSSLALTLLHYGEFVGSVESIYQSVDLLNRVLKTDQEDDSALIDRGYAYLVLSDLIMDPIHPLLRQNVLSAAERDFAAAAKLGNAEAYYYLACLYSLTELFEKSMDYLYRAEELESLPDNETLEQEEWLEGVKKTASYQEFAENRNKRL